MQINVKQTDNKYIANTYSRFPINLVSGKGSLLYDENGKEYIDMGSGIGVNAFGIADQKWIDAVTAQLGKLQHTSNLYYTEPCADLAQLLCESTGMSKVFFSNSGAEANECAIKTARKWAAENKGPEYYTIITLKNSFHGRTLATLSATGQEVFHKDFQPLPQGFVYGEANNLTNIEMLVKENKCAAIMFECIQGEGGVNPLTKEFVQGLDKLANKYSLLLVSDEVQCGNGRTGKLYAYMNYDIKPDIVSTAKGLGGGLPLGATLMGCKVKDTLKPGDHGSTFGGNPVCCAGAYNILSRIDNALLEDVQKKSSYIKEHLSSCPGIRSITGMGLMLGLDTQKPSSEIIAACMEKGVLTLSAHGKVRLLPPLNIPMDQLAKAVEIIKEVCA